MPSYAMATTAVSRATKSRPGCSIELQPLSRPGHASWASPRMPGDGEHPTTPACARSWPSGRSTTLRGFREFRFRDRNAFMINAEYRFEAFSGLDMALFSDWGDVGPTWDDIDFKHLKNDYGIGFRFNTYKSVWWRIDIGLGGDEGVHYWFKFSKAF